MPVLFLVVLSACGVHGPKPALDSVDPPVVCGENAATLTITGERFAPVVAPVASDPELLLPTVSFVRAGDATGADDGDVGRRVDLDEHDPAVRWIDARTFEVDYSPALGVDAGAWDVVVTNPDGTSATLPHAFVVMGPPGVSDVVPEQICRDAPDDVDIDVIGGNFLSVGGAIPSATLADAPVTVNGVDGCADLANGVGQVCDTVSLHVTPTSYTLGAQPLVLTNPDPAMCSSQSPARVEFTEPPTIATVSPSTMCRSGGVITVTGSHFSDGTVVAIGGVVASEVNVLDDHTLEATLAPETPLGQDGVLVVIPGGCTAFQEGVVTVTTEPDVAFVDPPIVYDQLSVRVTAYVADVSSAISSVTLLDDAGNATPLDFSWSEDDPGKVLATIPAGLPVGDYTLSVTQEDGCNGGLAAGLTVTDTLSVAIEAVDPPFAWTFDYTPVEITAKDPAPNGSEDFLDAPRFYLAPEDPSSTGAPISGVTFRDGTLVDAMVPTGLDPGVYDILAINPDGQIGLLKAGLEVTLESPPEIDSVGPPSLPNNGDGAITIHGREFRDPTVTLDCQENGATSTVTAPVSSWTYAEIAANVPVASFNTAVCVVRVTDSDGTWARYSAISIRNPAENLFPWSSGTDMVEERRAPAAVAGRTSSVSRYVWAIGGDDGTSSGAKSSIERAIVGVYGDMGTWEELDRPMPGNRTLAGVARIGRFVYLIGGNTGTTPTQSVWRAEILDPLEVPHLAGLSIQKTTDGTGLGAGTWTWRVAALYPYGYASNPGGEGLAGDPIIVDIPDTGDKYDVTLKWTSVNYASAYRVYRTPAADGDTTYLENAWDVTTTSWTDTGLATNPLLHPQKEGAIGNWYGVADLHTARQSPCVAVAPDPLPDPEVVYIYVAGGTDTSGNDLDSIEYLPIEVVDDETQLYSTWRVSAQTLSEAREQCAGYTVDSTLHSVVADGESWVYFAGGLAKGRATGTTDAGYVTTGGELSPWEPVDAMSPARAGFGSAAASDFLYAFGGQHGDPSKGGVSAELFAATMPAVQNWNALGTSVSVPRYLPGSAQESAVIFMLGGTTDTASASRSTDWTNY